MKRRTYGRLTGDAIGIIMKEIVRRAMNAIWQEQFIFEAFEKDGYGGKEDLVTSADKRAQAIYLKIIQECFLGFGIIAEEDGLRIACRIRGTDIYCTIDPLDGTKAYGRRQSHGIGTMISLIENGKIIAACVGDVMTGEIYYYRPDSPKVHRISKMDIARELVIDTGRPLAKQNLLLRDMPKKFSAKIQHAVIDANIFREWETTSGSIGISMARLWKSEVGGVLLNAGHVTPWDEAPIVGISQKLDFVFLRIAGKCDHLGFSVAGYLATPDVCKPRKRVFKRDDELLVVHKSRIQELKQYLEIKAA